jgi:hypothetical protein
MRSGLPHACHQAMAQRLSEGKRLEAALRSLASARLTQGRAHLSSGALIARRPKEGT